MKLISVEMFGNPDIKARAVMPDEEVGDRNKKQFEAQRAAALCIVYEDKEGNHKVTLTNETNYTYDGATIPFNIGKGDMRLLIPAMWHDIMCENKSFINHNRKLSSLVFKNLLRQCKVNKFTAQVMYLAVDNFQKFQKEWKKNE